MNTHLIGRKHIKHMASKTERKKTNKIRKDHLSLKKIGQSDQNIFSMSSENKERKLNLIIELKCYFLHEGCAQNSPKLSNSKLIRF